MKQTSFCCKTKRVNWIVLKNFSEALQQNRSSGFGSLQRKSWEPLMLTMKRSDGSTHPYCRSPTPTLNGRDLTLPTRTQTSEQEYSDLAASNRRSSTACSRNTPQSVWQGTLSYAFSRSTKHVKTSLAYSQDFSKFWWKVTCGLYCCGRDKNRTGYHSSLIQLFGGVFFQGTWQRNCWSFENSQKASRAAQNAPRAACLRPCARVSERLWKMFWFYVTNAIKCDCGRIFVRYLH